MKVYVSVQIVAPGERDDLRFNMRLCRVVDEHDTDLPSTELEAADEMWAVIREEVAHESR